MNTKKLIFLTISCLAAAPILNSCKSKILEPDLEQNKDTTHITVSRIPKKIVSYGYNSNHEACNTCKDEMLLTFDDNGYLLKKVHNFYDGTTLTKQDTTTYEWNNNKLVKETATGVIPSSPAQITTYLYNAQNKIAEVRTNGPSASTYIYSYSSEGRLMNIISEQDSSSIVETDSSFTKHIFRKHSGDGSWVPSADYTFIRSGNTLKMHEIGYSVTPDKVVSIFTESTTEDIFSDIPFSKQLQMVYFTPSDHKLSIFDFFPLSTNITIDGVTTESCTHKTTLDNFNRVTSWTTPCNGMNTNIEY